jgi:hypothetical protein
MSRRHSRISGQFSARLIEMLESPAFRVLSLSAHRVIDRIEIEHAHHGGKDNGRLIVTYDDFKSYGIHKHAIAPAIREAVALGFVEVTEHGRAGNAKWRTPNCFRLTFRHTKGLPGDGSHEWRRIDTLEAAEAIASTSRLKTFPTPHKRPPPPPEKGGGEAFSHPLKTGVHAFPLKTGVLSISRGGDHAASAEPAAPVLRIGASPANRTIRSGRKKSRHPQHQKREEVGR